MTMTMSSMETTEIRFSASDAEKLLTALATLKQLEPLLSAGVEQAAQARQRQREKNLAKSGLTKREIEVLELLAAGRNVKEMITLLCVTRKAVESHITHILSKLDVRSQAEALAEAAQRGLIYF